MEGQLGQGAHAFLVRVYVEVREVPGAPPRLAAWVQDLRTGEGRHTRTVTDVEDFIRRRLHDDGVDVSDWWPT
ncbi:hypothetical protein [Nonomuraea endophytica]|uniref:Uncharacterized protein n=1 Tax=Nonomuraea endophytica TaxID=714136 RepID=A0A7W8EKB7_9ACTN|nr:hypothetical protein [Nonomuraea endophytica]MBB5081597.1 hypothetical protein [Nonomuraea endophytica]